MKILALDTTGLVASVALVDENKTIAEFTTNYKKTHSQTIMPMVENLKNMVDLDLSTIDYIACACGPGSFTGLRIGMATIKGLSMGANKPYVSISSLDALANSLITFDGIICPIMDALRDNVYTALYKNIDSKLVKLLDCTSLDLSELAEILNEKGEKVIFTGDGMFKHKEFLSKNINNCEFAPNHLSIIRASSLGELGMEKLKSGEVDDMNSAPLYIKKPQAQRELEQRLAMKNENKL